MLYCPKCRNTYEEGSQRFCSVDGGRLLPVAQKSGQGSSGGGVFTSILGKMPRKDAADSAPSAKRVLNPRFDQPAKTDAPKPHAPISKIYETQRQIDQAPVAFDDDSILELDFDEPLDAPFRVTSAEPAFEAPVRFSVPAEPDAAPAESDVEISLPSEEAPKATARLVDPAQIPSGTAEIGDRASQPSGRTALSWDNPRALVGQTVKGRYLITELIGDDEDSLEFLAEDRITAGKRTSVRVFLNDDEFSEHSAEERISLSHLNHPNIAAVFDSGELPEGFRFVVSEFIEGESLSAALRSSGQFNTRRTARIIRQTSYALSEAHENGVLHRNLKPDNIMLTVSEAGIEQVKLVNFELSNGYWNESDLVYKSPEEIAGEAPTFASEIYSLAVIAYEMLTARLPFNALSERELLAAQKKGLTTTPSAVRLDIPELADRILEKALNFDSAERYPKARDFGDAYFNALTAIAPWDKPATEDKGDTILEIIGTDEAADYSIEAVESDETDDEILEVAEPQAKTREFFVVPPINPLPADETPVNGDIHVSPSQAVVTETGGDVETPAADGYAWTRRSPEPAQTPGWIWGALPVIGAVVLLFALWGVWKFLASRPADLPETETTQNAEQSQPTPGILPAEGEVDSPPPARNLKPAPGMTRYVNTQENLKRDLAKNFLGFEIYYPQEMKRTESATNFLDIATFADGIPVEQMLVTHYKSRGGMILDRPNFKKLAEKSNEQLGGYFKESFKIVGEGESAIQNGRWKGYEVKFEGLLPDGKTRVLGRRLWIPVQSPGTQNGFVITLLATSRAQGIDSVEDVGTKGVLAGALENFEPEQRF